MNTKLKSIKRERLWKENPHCYWCGKLTVLLPKQKHRKHYPANMATIDHYFSRLHPLRKDNSVRRGERWVLACYKCNCQRGHEEVLMLPIETRRAMSNRLGLRSQPNTSNPPNPSA